MIIILNHYLDMWRNFANFSGRTSVNGYWWALVLNWIVSMILLRVFKLDLFYNTVSLLPLFSLTIRRLNDSGKHWAWLFINVIPLLGWLISIIILCKPSKMDPLTETA